MGGGLMQLGLTAHRMFTLQVTHRSLFLRLSTADTLTFLNLLNRQ